MAGYSRQSAADIIANAVIKAAPVNAEYNALRDTFALATGHKHDGSSTEGGYVPLIADSDALNKVVIDTSNNRIGFFSEVSSAAVEQIRIQDGAIVPVTDNDIDLGASGTKFKNLYVNGIASIGSISLSGGTIDGTVIGGTTAAAADFTTMDASGNATVGGTLGVTGNVTMGGTLAVTGTTALTGTATITSADINSGAMDNTTIGNTTAAAGTFTNLTSTGTSTHATVDINGGAIDGVTIGAASAGAGTFTDLTASGTTTVTTADINGGNIDGTIIGASSVAAGSFTTVSTTGQATLATVDINGGAIDGAIIGASSAAAITGTTITGTSLVGAVTGNVTGDLTGDVTGDVTGDLTGNVTAGSGSSTFNNVTVNGTLDVTGTTIANVTDPSSAQDAATKNYVDSEISSLVDSAPGTLNTLNELAAALGDDASFSTTITNSIATKLPLAGGTMSGAIAMGTSKITGLGDPTADQDAATKKYTTDTFLPLAGGTLTGAIDMGSAKITTTYTPTNNADLTTKTYVDGILGSGTSAASSATAAASSATAAASSATAAASSATGAASSATSAAASYDSFDDRYLGAKSSAPTVDNDGDALVTGALYFNSTTNIMNVRTSGGAWTAAGSSVNGTSSRNTYTATAGQTTFASTYDSGYVDVYLNGVKLLAGTDFTATSGTSVVLASGAAVNDIVDIVAYGTFTLADHYTETESDARYLQLSGGTLSGDLTGTTITGTSFVSSGDMTFGDSNKAIFGAGSDLNIYHDTNHSIIEETGTGSLKLKGDDIRLEDASGNNIIKAVGSGSAELYESGNKKLETTSTGIDVTGGVSIDDDNNFSFGDGTTYIQGSGANDRIKFIVTSEQMRLTSTGLGIGTNSPIEKLHVSGQLISTGSNSTGSTSGAERAILDLTSNAARVGHFRGSTSSGSGKVEFFVDSVKRVTIDPDGKVGIGTGSPSMILDVDGSSGGNDVARFSGPNSGGLTFRNATSNEFIMHTATSDALIFGTNGNNERLRIVSGGDVSIGGVTPGNPGWARNLHVHGAGNGGGLKLTDNTSGSGNNDGLDIASYQGHAYFINRENATMRFHTNDTERMRITGDHALFGMTSADGQGVQLYTNGANAIWAKCTGTTNYWFTRTGQGAGVGTIATIFSDTTSVGSITVTASSTAFNTSSDYRLKENVDYTWDATTRLKQLKPARFNFIADADTTVDGFLAHEAQAVVPEAVTGTKDEVDADGNAVMQGIDQAKLVPLLVKTILELEARITALEGA